MDNRSLMEQLKHKESILRSVKENAEEILIHAKSSDIGAAGIEVNMYIELINIYETSVWKKSIVNKNIRYTDIRMEWNRFTYSWKFCDDNCESVFFSCRNQH